MRKALVMAIATAVMVVGVAPIAGAAWTPKKDVLRWTNTARNAPDVRLGWRLSKMARHHSREMADDGYISHSSWLPLSYWKENVGAGKPLRELFRGFMRSRTHRYAILRPCHRRVGIAVVPRNGFVWVTMIFKGPCG